MYTDFAEIYDELMDVNYDDWAAFYRRLMCAYGIPTGRVCECACGTGSMTIPLARLGYAMTGVDLSQDMLFHASQKARGAGLGIPFVCQDMRQLRLHRSMDAVLATCDGVNYLLTDEDVLSFFRAAYAALKPGGGLFFDVSTPYKLKNTLGNQLLWQDEEHITYLWQNSWDEASRQVSMQLCFFVREKDGRYRRVDEDQVQKAHSAESLVRLLEQAGFERICVYGNGRMDVPHPQEQRWHLAALRPREPEQEEL